MKYFAGLTVLKYSWDQVATGFWSRYPNPYRYVYWYLMSSVNFAHIEYLYLQC